MLGVDFESVAMGDVYLFEEQELRDWAYNPEKFNGLGQDFGLSIAGLHRSAVILQCAADNDCPKQEFFLACAFQIVGDAVASSHFDARESEILAFVRRAEKTGNEYLLEFVWRARDLIQNPTQFERDQWCDGLLARSLLSQ